MSIKLFKVQEKRPTQSSFCTFKNTILFIHMYKKWPSYHFYIHTGKETEFSDMHFNHTKNTIVGARLQKSRREIISSDFVLTEEQHPEQSNLLVTPIYTENTGKEES